MWKFIFKSPRIINLSGLATSFCRRTFLSKAYLCEDAWNARLKSPILQKVDVGNLFHELDIELSHFGRANPVDVDLFMNTVESERFVDEVETLLQMLRISPDTTSTFPSTHYATVRVLLEHGRMQSIIKLISDRLTYGVFPDRYCCNILMNTYLQEKNYSAAARVAVTQMLQEDWESLLTTRLCVYSCHMFLRNPDQPWLTPDEIKPPPEVPTEVVKVRVKYIRDPFYDDHFDIEEPKMLVGKTLSMFAPKLGANEKLQNSYKVLGLTLHKKWSEVIKLSNLLASKQDPIYKEAVVLARKHIQETLSPQKDESDQKPPDNPTNEDEKSQQELYKNLDKVLSDLEQKAVDGDLCTEMENLVKEAVIEFEPKDIEEQKNLFKKWEENRAEVIRAHQYEVEKENARKRIEQQKLELLQKEEEIFFFDNENKLDLLIEKRELEEMEENSKKQHLKKTATAESETVDEEYIPPEVSKRQTVK